MNFPFPSKRIHSPADDDNTATIMPGQPHARKKVITDDMFTNKMAGLSLAYSTENDSNQDPSHVVNNNDNSGGRWRKDQVERVDDIDQYLADDENDAIEDDDTYLGAAPELVGVSMGNTILPFERIPGATGLRIPDFVLHGNDDAIDRTVYESTRKQFHQYHDHHPSPTLTSPPFQPTDNDQPQPMDLD